MQAKHISRSENLYHGYLDYDGALAELEIARKTLPNDPRLFELKVTSSAAARVVIKKGVTRTRARNRSRSAQQYFATEYRVEL
jgi:hypothetical protein